MAMLTDPADELARACDRLIATPSKESGQAAIASAVGVDAWSKEFFQIVFCLIEQADRVRTILEEQGLPEAYISRASLHLDGIKAAFTPAVMRQAWDTAGSTRQVLKEHVSPLAMLSPTVARSAQYPLLSADEIVRLLADIDQLLSWLDEHQLEDNDILRLALADGLRTYRFRLERIGWLGWEYSAEALRISIGAYLAVERGQTSADAMPITEAALIKTGEFFGKIWRLTGVVADANDRVGAALKLYGFVSMVRDGSPVVGAITQQLGS